MAPSPPLPPTSSARRRDGDRLGLSWRRSVVFTVVGVIGMGVQLAALWALAGRLGLHYLPATVLATEMAVLHNFVWHVRWTWADRPAPARVTFERLVRFHVTNGLVSLVGNSLLMALLAGCLSVQYLVANVMSILACALVNLIVSEAWVFRRGRHPGCELSANGAEASG
jgi:putative flippase GtrA